MSFDKKIGQSIMTRNRIGIGTMMLLAGIITILVSINVATIYTTKAYLVAGLLFAGGLLAVIIGIKVLKNAYIRLRKEYK